MASDTPTWAASTPERLGHTQSGDTGRMSPLRQTWIVPALALVVVVLLTVGVVSHSLGIDAVDLHVRHWVWTHQVRWLFHVCDDITYVVSPSVDVIALGVFALSTRRSRFRPAAVMMLSLAAVVLGMKYGIDRAMPTGAHPARGAFPSGHTATFFVAAGTALTLSDVTGAL